MPDPRHVEAARWLARNGYSTTSSGVAFYQTPAGQMVRLHAGNQAAWLEGLNRRFAEAFPDFQFTPPTAAQMNETFGSGQPTRNRASTLDTTLALLGRSWISPR